MNKKLLFYLLILACVKYVFCAPPTTIWDRNNKYSLDISSNGSIRADVSKSTVAISNFPTDYPDSNSNAKLTSIDSKIIKCDTNNIIVSSGSIEISNQISGYALETTLSSIDNKIKEVDTKSVAISSGNITVNNFPDLYNTSGSTVIIQNIPSDYAKDATLSNLDSKVNIVNTKDVAITSGTVIISSGSISIRDDGTSRVVIRNLSPDRNLAINTYNGIDVRLLNNTGTLISDTNALPVNYSVYISSYVEIESSTTIKSGSTYLARVIIGTAGTSSSLTIRNGTSGTSPIVAVIDTATSKVIDVGAILGSGLYIENTGGTPAKITLIYR